MATRCRVLRSGILAAMGLAVIACGGSQVASTNDGARRGITAQPTATPDPDDPPTAPPAPAASAPLTALIRPAAVDPAGPATADSGLPTDADLEEAWARVLLRANPGPFQYCAYELTARGAAGVASTVKGVMGRSDAITRTELVPKQKLRAILGRLRDIGALDLPHPPRPWQDKAVKAAEGAKIRRLAAGRDKPGSDEEIDELASPPTSHVPIYELSFRLGGRENSFLVADPYVLADRRYGACIDAVRAAVVDLTGDVAWQPPTGSKGAHGYLFVDAVPAAQVAVDGAQLPEETPIFAYALESGSHTVVLENKKHGLRREYKVRVTAGQSTSLDVDLR
jgi:hypothetical protein